jgi:hypothetical protein
MLVSALWVVYSYPKGLVHQVRDWYSGVAIKMGRRQGGPSRTGIRGSISESIRDRGATQPPAHFHRNPPGRASFGRSGSCRIAHRSKTTAGILPLRFAHPAKYAAAPLYQSRTWCTSSADLRLRLERRRGRESRHPLPRDRIPCVQLLRVESSNIVSEAGVRGF